MKRKLLFILALLLTMVTQGAWASGELNGVFSVSSTKKVCFSKGNLQAKTTNKGTSWSWAFATNQYDYIGGRTSGGSQTQTGNNYINGNGTTSANATVDLFGWVGASSTTWSGNTMTKGNAAMNGISNSTADPSTTNDYGNVTSEALKSDWGTLMGSGWHTLTKNEWNYLFNTRKVNGGTGSGKSYTLGKKVNGVLGVVLYPDNYTGSAYTGSKWSTFESAG